MNRELKFRVWDKENKKLTTPPVDVLYLCLSLSGRLIQIQHAGSTIGAINDIGDTHELMQYTGLKDKNGKEIYDGDIIKVHFGEWVEYEPEMHGGEIYDKKIVKREARDYIGEVRWRVVGGTGFIVKELENRWFRFNKKKTSEGTEVIGNIYENPELYEENK